jgi:hypothetical protein
VRFWVIFCWDIQTSWWNTCEAPDRV